MARPVGSTNYTAEQFIKAIPGTGGIISAIAKKVDCDWYTAKKFITEYPTVKKAYEAECEGVIDLAEVELIKSVKAGDFPAIKFYLATKGRGRGYYEKIEVSAQVEQELTKALDVLQKGLPPEVYESVLSILAGEAG